MTSGRLEYALAVVAVFCVLAIFFFPAMQGPYSVVHGPVTALLSLRAAAGLRFRIVRAGLNLIAILKSFAELPLVTLGWAVSFLQEMPAFGSLAGSSTILRC